jgi:hypothetical protein
MTAWLMAGDLRAEDPAAQHDTLTRLANQLSAGDVSVLVEGLKSSDHQMLTTEGSPNDVFWSAAAELGLMQQVALPAEMAKKLEGTGLVLKIFSVTPRGQAELPALVPRLKQN